MPRPEQYVAKDGSVSWRVRFRRGGKQTSETFHSRTRADGFVRDLKELGPDEAVERLEDDLSGHGDVTLDEIAVRFFEWKDSRVRSDRTVADYRRDYKNWIKPTLGHRRVVGITDTDIQRWVDTMQAGMKDRKPAAPKSVADRHALLYAILAHGVKEKAIDHNPATGTDLPKKQRGMPKGLRPAEWAALHSALATVDQDYADVAEGLLATGWRWSEVAGMAAYQVEDLDHGVWVTMERVMRRNKAGQHVIVDEGKGQASVRRIKVDTAAAAMFRRRIVGKGPSDPVFTTKGGAPLHYSNFMRDGWNPAVKASKLARRPTPHWLRHTHVVWMALTGAGLPELQSRIGHASINTTINVYGRMLTDVSATSLDAFAAMRDGAAPARQIEG